MGVNTNLEKITPQYKENITEQELIKAQDYIYKKGKPINLEKIKQDIPNSPYLTQEDTEDYHCQNCGFLSRMHHAGFCLVPGGPLKLLAWMVQNDK